MSMSGFEGWLRSTTGVITAGSALLVAIVGLASAGHGLYLFVSGAPKTDKETVRAATYKKHINDSPVQTQPITVQLENFSVTAIVDVYKDGDINLTVGPNSEWFPFNPVRQGTLIRKAFAEAAVSPAGRYVQTQREEGRTIVRERIYENGFRETVVIAQNTGQIIRRSTEMRPLSAEEKARVERGTVSRPPIIIK